jgi:hypothetical protein
LNDLDVLSPFPRLEWLATAKSHDLNIVAPRQSVDEPSDDPPHAGEPPNQHPGVDQDS